MNVQKAGVIVFGFWATFTLPCLGAWITHIVWSIKMLMSPVPAAINQLVLAGVGAIVPPVGVIHGFILWFS